MKKNLRDKYKALPPINVLEWRGPLIGQYFTYVAMPLPYLQIGLVPDKKNKKAFFVKAALKAPAEFGGAWTEIDKVPIAKFSMSLEKAKQEGMRVYKLVLQRVARDSESGE